MLKSEIETRPRSAIWSLWVFSVLFVVRVLCDSMLYVLMIFLGTWRVQSFGVHLRPNACTGSTPAWTVRAGWCGDCEGHRWGSLYSQFVSGSVYHFFIIRNLSNFPHIYLWLCTVNFLTYLSVLLARCGLVVTCFFVNLPLDPHICLWWISVEQLESRPTDPRLRHWRVSLHVPRVIDGRLLKYIKTCDCLSLNINGIQRCRKIVLRNMVFRPWSNMLLMCEVSHSTSEILSSFKIWIFDLGLLILLLKVVLQNLAWSRRPAWYAAVDNGCLSCNISPVLHGIESHFVFLNVHLYWFESFYVHFRWWQQFGIFRFRFQESTRPTSCLVQSVFREYPSKTFVPNWWSRLWPFADIVYHVASNPKGMMGPSNGELEPTFVRRLANCLLE